MNRNRATVNRRLPRIPCPSALILPPARQLGYGARVTRPLRYHLRPRPGVGVLGGLLLAALIWSAALAGAPRSPDAAPPSATSTTSAPTDPLAEARRLRLRGEYDAAESLYRRLSEHPDSRLAAACGLTEIDLRRGRYREGIERLRGLPPDLQATADWHAGLAALLAETGQMTDAAAHNRAALAVDARHLRARCQLGRIQEIRGDLEAAIKTYRLFDEIMTGDRLPDDPESLTWLGQGFLRHSLLTRHPNLVRRTKHVLHRVYQEAFDQIDPDFWPARLAAANPPTTT